MKKIVLSLLAVASLSVNAQERFEVDNVTYTITGVDEVTLDSAGAEAKKVTDLRIPSRVTYDEKTYVVTAISDYAYQWTNATSIKVPGSVKTIGRSAFYYGTPQVIQLGNGIETIGSYAFSGKGLTQLDIPASVKVIGDHAFFGTSSGSSFTKLTLHEGLEEIGDGAFYGNAIETLEIPGTCKKIGKSAFLYSTKLKSLTLHEGVEEIGDGAFVNGEYKYNSTTELKSVTLPKSLKKIGIEAFLRMPLTSINLPAGLEELGESAFAKTKISKFTVDDANEYFTVDDQGLLMSKDGRICYACPMTGVKEVSLDECVGINGGAFWGSEIEQVNLSDGIIALGYGAFMESPLKTINLPNTITYIDEYCFAGSKVENIILPESLYVIYEATFAQCTNLKSVVIPSSVQAIDIRAFIYSDNLTSVTCKGSYPPYLVEINEYEDIFTSNFTLYVPKGCSDNYKASMIGELDNYWPNYYGIVKETDQGIVQYTAATPAFGSVLAEEQSASFVIEFAEPLILRDAEPAVGLRLNAPYYPSQNFENGWKATVDGNKLTVFAPDADGFATTFATDDEHTYYITIPAGVVRNEAGDQNECIVLGYYGYGHDTAIEQVLQGSKPASGKVAARYNLNGQQTTAAKKGLQIVRYSDGTARKVIVK